MRGSATLLIIYSQVIKCFANVQNLFWMQSSVLILGSNKEHF